MIGRKTFLRWVHSHQLLALALAATMLVGCKEKASQQGQESNIRVTQGTPGTEQTSASIALDLSPGGRPITVDDLAGGVVLAAPGEIRVYFDQRHGNYVGEIRGTAEVEGMTTTPLTLIPTRNYKYLVAALPTSPTLPIKVGLMLNRVGRPANQTTTVTLDEMRDQISDLPMDQRLAALNRHAAEAGNAMGEKRPEAIALMKQVKADAELLIRDLPQEKQQQLQPAFKGLDDSISSMSSALEGGDTDPQLILDYFDGSYLGQIRQALSQPTSTETTATSGQF